MNASQRAVSDTRVVDLDLDGMTCASCVNHVTKSLDALPGVRAEVNLATERARVTVASAVSDDELIAAVRGAGYQASVRGASASHASTEAHGHADSHSHHGAQLTRRLIVAAILSIPVLAVSMVPAWQFDAWQYVVFALSTPVVLWAGWPFHRAAWANLKQRTASMDTLVSVGTLVAYAWSVWALFFGGAGMIGMRHEWSLLPSSQAGATNGLYFEVAAVLTTLILLGRWLEARSRRRAGAALNALAALLPDTARVLEQAAPDPGNLLAPTRRERVVPINEVQAGQLIVLLPGQTVPVDGRVAEGSGSVDESALTGESVPRQIVPGDQLSAGSTVLDARLLLTAERVGVATRLAQLTELVDAAQLAKSAAQRLADRISAVFVPAVLALAALTGLAWWWGSGDGALALSIAIAVVIIACPCALGLATPVAIMAGTGRGAQLGIVISGPDAMERSRRIRSVFLDKTGTLTEGRFALSSVHISDASGGFTEELALAQLAALESGSQHPLAAAVQRAAEERGLSLPPVAELRTRPGEGVTGRIRDTLMAALSPHALSDAQRAGLGESLARAIAESTETTVVLLANEQAVAVVGFADQLKPDAAEAVAQLRALGVTPVMLTGDRAAVASRAAELLGITDWRSELSPEDKLAAVRAAQQRGEPVAMVGDGINDAAALASADLGVAIGSGTDLARAASDITVLRSDAVVIPQSIRLARATHGIIIGNLVWAFGYNVAAIPLAMAGLLNPMIAGVAMAFSSVFVVLNSIRLTRFR